MDKNLGVICVVDPSKESVASIPLMLIVYVLICDLENDKTEPIYIVCP